MRAEFINPFVSAAQSVFRTMVGCELSRGALSLRNEHTPIHEVSGLIGISGQWRGMVVVCVSRETAMSAAEVMLGARPEQLNGDVMDAVGEITNMVAGAAKSQLEKYNLSIGLPTVICGKGQVIKFPPGTRPIVIPFDAPVGPVSIEVGLVESSPD